MRLRLSLLLVSSLFPIVSFATQDTAETCTTVDLTKSPGLGEPLNRDGTGWCFAYVAADLASVKAGQRISAFDVNAKFQEAVRSSWWKRFTTARTKDFSAGGDSEYSLDAISGQAMCSEADLPSDYKMNDLYNYMQAVANLKSKAPKESATQKEKDAYLQAKSQACASAAKIAPTVLSSQVKKIIDEYDGDYRLIELAKAGCKNRIQVPKLELQKENVQGENFAKLDAQLDKKNIVGLEYDIRFLDVGPGFAPEKVQRKSHVSTIVGRRFKNGKCEYLIRGSSGRAVNYSYASPYRENNKGGNVWVDKETLAFSSGEMIYVK